MKRVGRIVSRGLAIALVALVIASYSEPLIALAHEFPHDLSDWSQHDWEKFYEYYSKNNYPNDPAQREWSYYNQQGVWYNNHYVYQDSNGWYYIDENANRVACSSPYQQNYNYNYYPYYNYSNANNNGYAGYNYYGGVLNNYDAATEGQAQILAKIMYLYAHGVASQTAQACVGWTVMNSIDASSGGVDIGAIAPNFHYDASKPTTDDFGRDLMPLARDVIFRWKAGKAGVTSNGRVLPSGYCYVWSTGSAVVFRNTPNESGAPWGYSYTSPYGN